MAGPGHTYPLTSQGSLPGPVLTSQGSLSGPTMTSQGSLSGTMTSQGSLSGPTMTSQGSLSGPTMTSQGSLSGTTMTSQPGSLSGPTMTSPASTGSGPFTPQMGTTGHQASSQPGGPGLMSPTKSLNIVSLCKMGQETNHELVQKLLDVFKTLKSMQLPNGTNTTMYQERRQKIDESLRQLEIFFKKLRVIYDKVNEVSDPEELPEEALIPMLGQPAVSGNTHTDAYRYVTEEHKQVVEQIRRRNHEIKEIIDKIRTIVWEINTMIVMRKT